MLSNITDIKGFDEDQGHWFVHVQSSKTNQVTKWQVIEDHIDLKNKKYACWTLKVCDEDAKQHPHLNDWRMVIYNS